MSLSISLRFFLWCLYIYIALVALTDLCRAFICIYIWRVRIEEQIDRTRPMRVVVHGILFFFFFFSNTQTLRLDEWRVYFSLFSLFEYMRKSCFVGGFSLRYLCFYGSLSLCLSHSQRLKSIRATLTVLSRKREREREYITHIENTTSTDDFLHFSFVNQHTKLSYGWRWWWRVERHV